MNGETTTVVMTRIHDDFKIKIKKEKLISTRALLDEVYIELTKRLLNFVSQIAGENRNIQDHSKSLRRTC